MSMEKPPEALTPVASRLLSVWMSGMRPMRNTASPRALRPSQKLLLRLSAAAKCSAGRLSTSRKAQTARTPAMT